MFQNGKSQLDLIKKLSFNRVGGSIEELRAATILKETVTALASEFSPDANVHLEGFLMPWYEVRKVSVCVTKPFYREIEARGVGFSGCLPEGGITAPLLYAEQGLPISLRDAGGKIILLNDMVYENWPAILKSGALAYLVAIGEYDDEDARTDLSENYLRDHQLKIGSLPGIHIRAHDAIALLQEGAEEMHVELCQEKFERVSHNVIAEIPGSKITDEIIGFTAHYDSVPFSSGAWDNATGCADILGLFAYFLEHRPQRTLRFIWCGSEERGLLGSLAYTKAHRDEMERFRLVINLDMTGPVLGFDRAIVTGDPTLISNIEYMAREAGHAIHTSQTVHPSDSTPFADCGIPAVSFSRWGRAAGHSRRDLDTPLGEHAIAHFQNFMRFFASRMINSSEFPIPRDMPQNMKEELNKYFHRS
ncbi:MAG: M28 family metallopeptidase [Eubacteriales bacterium]|jgi:aminopeptidase YwaD